MKKRNLALLTALLAFALTACGGGSDAGKDATQGSEAAKEGEALPVRNFVLLTVRLKSMHSLRN